MVGVFSPEVSLFELFTGAFDRYTVVVYLFKIASRPINVRSDRQPASESC
jgi:hypothetical protein